jgi:ABC-type lipoprotein release transport system permease subunit
MTLVTFAFRNLLGAGMKTWLRVTVLSLAFVVIVALQGVLTGTYEQATVAVIDAEFGGGQYWHERYDPQDPLSLDEAHGPVPAALDAAIGRGEATPILVLQGFMYAGGSFRPVLLRGIDPAQGVLMLPTRVLAAGAGGQTPALIGARMAKQTGLSKGDSATIRWRDARGTFDARDVVIAEVMSTMAATVDSGQIWLPLEALRDMARMDGEASWVVLAKEAQPPGEIAGWTFRNLDFLLKDITDMIRMKSVSSSIAFGILLLLAMLAILDTQVLSIFHRRKEIGTLMALGLTRRAVIAVFTFEGAFNAVLAALAAAVYGVPLLAYLSYVGIPMPAAMDATGFAIGDRLYPIFGAGLVLGSTAVVLIATTVVSYLPTRTIARLKPTDALRGRLT